MRVVVHTVSQFCCRQWKLCSCRTQAALSASLVTIIGSVRTCVYYLRAMVQCFFVLLQNEGGIWLRKFEPRLPPRNKPSWVRFKELFPFWILLTLWSKVLSVRLPRSSDSSVVLPLWKWPIMNNLMEVFWRALHRGRRRVCSVILFTSKGKSITQLLVINYNCNSCLSTSCYGGISSPCTSLAVALWWPAARLHVHTSVTQEGQVLRILSNDDVL